MTLPTFLVIGAMKAGTSSLNQYLRAHPEVAMAKVKELNFFTGNWERGRAWYEAQFDGAGDAKAIGEASPSYGMAHSFPVAERIASVVPDVKLVYLLRHPYERMRSAYQHWVAGGKERRPAEQAFTEDLNYLHMSRYAFQIESYLAFFPREQLLLVLSEDLKDDRVPTLRRIFSFLGVDADLVPANVAVEANRSDARRVYATPVRRLRGRETFRTAVRLAPAPVRRLARRAASRPAREAEVHVSAELEARIMAALADDVRKLRAYLGPDFHGWGIA